MALRAGFIGLGNIGAPMAARLVARGLETTVHDLRPEPVQELVRQGAKAAGSPRQLAAASDVVGICVRDDDEVRGALCGDEGVLAGAAPGTVVAVHSTVLPQTVESLAEEARARQVDLLDVCLTGGAARAQQGELTLLAGGDAEPLERARPYLDAVARTVLPCGPLGSGCKAKLCLNVLTYLQWTAAFEASSLARAVGLPVETLEAAGRANGQLTDLMVQFLSLHKLPEETRRSEGMQNLLRGHTLVAEKDLAWALQLARQAGIGLPGAALASQIMARVYGLEDPGRR